MIVPATSSSWTCSRVQLRVGGDLAEDGEVGVGRHDDGRLDLAGDGVLGQGVARVPLGRHGQPREAQGPGHRDGHRHPPVLEREGRVRAEAGMMPALVLDLEPAADPLGQGMVGTGAMACSPRPG